MKRDKGNPRLPPWFTLPPTNMEADRRMLEDDVSFGGAPVYFQDWEGNTLFPNRDPVKKAKRQLPQWFCCWFSAGNEKWNNPLKMFIHPMVSFVREFPKGSFPTPGRGHSLPTEHQQISPPNSFLGHGPSRSTSDAYPRGRRSRHLRRCRFCQAAVCAGRNPKRGSCRRNI